MDSSATHNDNDDVDAEGEVVGDANAPMTLVDAGGLASALGLPSPAPGSGIGNGGSALAGGGVGKRYRPAPAKTFQCRGYGECRMVFSRSEHLARHVRKHTGERPFACHCSKQFSRLDNLRQHAQTVHADKGPENEAMMRELTSLHASMTGGVAPTTSPTSASGASTSTAAASGPASNPTSGSPPPPSSSSSGTNTSKRPAAKRTRASASVKREPVEDAIGLGLSGLGLGFRAGKPRPGTSTGYEGAAAGYRMATATGRDVQVDGDRKGDGDGARKGKDGGAGDVDMEPHHPQKQEPSLPLGGRGSFRGDSSASHTSTPNGHSTAQSFRAPEAFREPQQPSPISTLSSSFRPATAEHAGFRSASGSTSSAADRATAADGFRDADGRGFRGDVGAGGPFDAHWRYEQQQQGGTRERPGTGTRSFLGGVNGGNGTSNNNDSHSGGNGQSFRGPQFIRRSPPASTPSPPTPLHNGNGIPHRISSGSFSSGRPFSSGNADAILAGSSFSGSSGGALFSSGSRPSTGSGARLPPLSAVVSAAAFRPPSGHGLPAPGSAGDILLPNSLTLRRPSTSDWEWGDAWSVRPGTAPGNLATAPVDDSPFSFHPPEQPTASFGVSALGGIGNSRKRTLGGPDGPYGAHPDDGDGSGGGYEYGNESRPTSRRFSVMELCNDDTPQQRPASSSFGLSVLRGGPAERERERERPTTTNGLISRASALVLHDHDQQSQWELESRQHASEQRFAADPFAAAGGGARSRPGSVRGLDAAAANSAAAAGARASAGGRGDGGVSQPSAGGGAGAGAFLPSAAANAGGGAAHRGGEVPFGAAASAVAGLLLRASPSSPPPAAAAARARDGYGFDGAGHGDDGGVFPPAAYAPAGHGADSGRLPLSPPGTGPYRGGGLAGAGLPGGYTGLSSLYGASAPSPAAVAAASPPASPPASPSSAAYRDASRASRGGLPGIAVFARVPAHPAGGVPVRGDDALLDVRRFDDSGVRYAPGGRAEVREFVAGHGVGRGPGSPGYEYEHEYEHGPGHRVGGGRSSGMRV